MTSFSKTGVSVATRYDAAGRRIRKIYNSETTVWVYDSFGRLAAEYRNGSGPGFSASSPERDYVYFAGKLKAVVEGSEIYYRTTDHLGSTRLVTGSAGDVKQRRDFFPFGENIPADSSHGGRNGVTDGGVATYNASLGVRQQFTGQQRDAESGLDYFWERCFCSQLARFLSVDPENTGALTANPQLWNGYSSAKNNPVRYTDPTGKFIPYNAYDTDWYLVIVVYQITDFYDPFPWPAEPAPPPNPQQISTPTPMPIEVTPTARAKQLFTPSWGRALQALLGNDLCRNMFGGGSGWDPVEVLHDLAFGRNVRDSGKVISIEYKDLNTSRTAETSRTSITIDTYQDTGPYEVNGQTYTQPRAWWNLGYVDANAHTLLHELGHLYNCYR